MSKIIIEFLNNQKIKYDITGIAVKVMEKFIKIEKENTIYTPLCNIKSIQINGANEIKEV